MNAVDRQPRGIPGGKFGRHIVDLEIAIDGEAAEPVALDRKACGQRMGLHAGAPDHRRGVDALTSRERDAVLINGSHRNTDACLDTECLEGLGDHRPGALTHIGPDPRLPIGEDDSWRGVMAGNWGASYSSAKFAKHFRCDLDAGEPAANHKNVVLARGSPAERQLGYVMIEAHRGLVSVDVECILRQAGDGRADEAAAKSE